MELLRLSTGLLLPWLAGTLWLMLVESCLEPSQRPHRLRQAGYGFFLGYGLLALLALTENAWAGQISWNWIMALLAAFTGFGALALWLAPPRTVAPRPPQPPAAAVPRVLWVVLAAWMGLHLLFLAIDVLNLPLYPWDAWLAWVYRAKAWFLAGGMVEVVGPYEWTAAASPDVYTIDAAGYPLFPSIIPYWAALSFGSWSETLINLPVLLAGLALGLALYGQCRESGMGRLASVAACYLLFSIPLFATHIALAGYADIWMAGFTGLGFLALVRGLVTGQRVQSVLGFLMVAFAMLVKHEGVVWFLAAALLWVLTTVHWRNNIVAGLVLGVTTWAASAWFDRSYIEIPYAGTLGVQDGRLEIPFIGSFVLEAHDVWQAYLDNFFALGSWNLLWVLVGFSLLLAATGKHPVSLPARRVGATFILVFLSTQLFIFGFTDQGTWADTYTAINRLPLHFVPALVYSALLIIGVRVAPLEPGSEAEVGMGNPRFASSATIVASLVAALIVIAGALGYLTRDLPGQPIEPSRFAASDLTFVMGSGETDSDQTVVSGFENGYALLSSGPIEIRADAYRFLEVELASPGGTRAATLFWRRSETPDDLFQLTIQASAPAMIDLASETAWRGEISELGFLLREEDGKPFTIGPAVLEPDSLAGRLRLTWRSWTAFEAWSQRSINFLWGGTAKQPLRLPPLVLGWFLIACALTWLLAKVSGKINQRALIAAVVALGMGGWMILDLRWTANNLRQAAQTIQNNWGVDEAERLGRGLDGGVFQYIRRLKDEILPGRPSRILIVSGERAVDYFLQRAKYHLVPHSALVAPGLQGGVEPEFLDYVIFFGPKDEINRLPGWDKQWQYALEVIDVDEYAVVYRVKSR